MTIQKYPDGSSYFELSKITTNPKTFKINSYEDLWHLNQYVDAYNYYHKSKPTIIIPSLIDSQADRRFAEDQSFGLKLVCQFLNGMNANFKIFHPHNPEVVEALMDNVEIIDNSEFVLRVLNLLNANPIANNNVNIKNIILMSSDSGSFKPLMKLCDKINWKGQTLSASKYRWYLNGETKLSQVLPDENIEGKDILIVDDISVYGGTFKGLSKLLKERNCGKLYLAVSHMTVQNLGKDPVTNYFDKVFTINSKYDNYFIENNPGFSENAPNNLEIIKLF
jgi:ribose-phosphate pyrophosphokinase